MITKVIESKKLIDSRTQSSECLHPVGFSTDVCASGHVSTRLFRCKSCEGCEIWRIRSIRAQVFNRIQQNELKKQEGLLWTFGTNLKYDSKNYAKFRKYWTKLVDWIRHTYPSFVLYFRVFEAGSKGGRLHIHAVTNIWSTKSDFNRIRRKWSEITTVKNPNVNFRRVKRCKHCKRIVDFYKTKVHCQRKNFEKVGIKTAILYLTKYLTKEQKEKVGMRHNYYWGKPLFYRWKTLETKQSGWNYDANEPMTFTKVETNGNGHYREIGHIYGRSYKEKDGKYIVDSFHRMSIKKYWRDVDIVCPVKDCENIVIKGINMMRYDKAHQLMWAHGIPKVKIKEILGQVVMRPVDDYT